MKKIYIFGAGNNGRKLNEKFSEYGIDIEAFIDNNLEKQEKKIANKDCISIQRAIEDGAQEATILISPNKHVEIEKQLRENGFRYVYPGYKIIKFIPEIYNEKDYEFVCPFGSYESPYPNIVEIHKRETEIFDKKKKVLEIDFNLSRQLKLAKLMENLDLIDWKVESIENRYCYNNSWFAKGSADVLYYMINILKPKRIVEVGSGFSTAVMLDTNEHCFKNKIEITSIEPNPSRLNSILKPKDSIAIKECFVQDVAFEVFEQLKEDDILFIDSSHVSRFNSDVDFLFFEVFPRLNKGVYIHFHDMFYPFIYPKEWVYQGRAYNEMSILRAFLMHNNAYSIQFFGEMLEYCCGEKLSSKLKGNCSGSIWIRKDRDDITL